MQELLSRSVIYRRIMSKLMVAMQKCDFTRGLQKKQKIPVLIPIVVPKAEGEGKFSLCDRIPVRTHFCFVTLFRCPCK